MAHEKQLSPFFRLCIFIVMCSNEGSCTVNTSPSIGDTFRQCLVSQPSLSLGHCLGVGAMSKLQSLDSDPEFDLVDGVTLSRDQQEFRDTYNFAEHDPSDLRSLLDSMDQVFQRRSLRWDLNFLYPGLFMRVSPSVSPGGVLEFALDPHIESLNTLSLKEASTGRLLARQFVVPFLLGFKFNLATLIPILFGILALIAKKAVILSKIALVASSAYGVGSLLFGPGHYNKFPTNTYQSQETFNPSFGGHYKFPDHEYADVYYRGVPSQTATDSLRLYTNNIPHAYEQEAKGRNFAWDEDEKKQKSKEKI